MSRERNWITPRPIKQRSADGLSDFLWVEFYVNVVRNKRKRKIIQQYLNVKANRATLWSLNTYRMFQEQSAAQL